MRAGSAVTEPATATATTTIVPIPRDTNTELPATPSQVGGPSEIV